MFRLYQVLAPTFRDLFAVEAGSVVAARAGSAVCLAVAGRDEVEAIGECERRGWLVDEMDPRAEPEAGPVPPVPDEIFSTPT